MSWMMMTENRQVVTTLDKVKWLIIAVLISAGVGANQYYSDHAFSLRLIGWILLSVVVLGLAITTAKGKAAKEFARQARIELRKVVWPTRKETIQTTFIVMVMVFIVALFLWGLDSLLLVLVRWFMG